MLHIYRKIIVVLALLLTLNFASTGFVHAKMYLELSRGEKIYYITGSALFTPVYLPVKIIYTGIGLATSGIAFIGTAGFAKDWASTMAKRSIGGDWYIHPDYLLGNQKLRLFEPAAVITTPVAAPEVAPTPAPQTAPASEAAPAPTPEAVPAPTPETAPAPAPEVAPAPAPTPEATLAPTPEVAPAK